MTYEPRTSTAHSKVTRSPSASVPVQARCLCGVLQTTKRDLKHQNILKKKHWGRWRLEPGLRVRHGLTSHRGQHDLHMLPYLNFQHWASG